jgi:hypothetical protein
MKVKKRTFDLIFIAVSAVILITLYQFGLLERLIGFSLIPILIAYQFGQYAERKFKN